ncbi:unnamed protein product [Phytophthora fragariaefolia]|uniref:Unnamed protein product n=1 Tax=Phytophthora fragariaefolia TaxID=1490495 RepID=A0A9W7D1T1_9STRA|nr:unnamed protein product [Phytophthora fragariaefolia]
MLSALRSTWLPWISTAVGSGRVLCLCVPVVAAASWPVFTVNARCTTGKLGPPLDSPSTPFIGDSGGELTTSVGSQHWDSAHLHEPHLDQYSVLGHLVSTSSPLASQPLKPHPSLGRWPLSDLAEAMSHSS